MCKEKEIVICVRRTLVIGGLLGLVLAALAVGATGCGVPDSINNLTEKVDRQATEIRAAAEREVREFLHALGMSQADLKKLIEESLRQPPAWIDRGSGAAVDVGKVLAEDIEQRLVALMNSLGQALEDSDRELVDAFHTKDRAKATAAIARILKSLSAKPLPMRLDDITPRTVQCSVGGADFRFNDPIVQLRGNMLDRNLLQVNIDGQPFAPKGVTCPSANGRLMQLDLRQLPITPTTSEISFGMPGQAAVLSVPVIVNCEPMPPVRFVESVNGVELEVPKRVALTVTIHTCQDVREEMALDICAVDGKHLLQANTKIATPLDGMDPAADKKITIEGPRFARLEGRWKTAPFQGDFMPARLILKRFDDAKAAVVSADPGTSGLSVVDIRFSWDTQH